MLGRVLIIVGMKGRHATRLVEVGGHCDLRA